MKVLLLCLLFLAPVAQADDGAFWSDSIFSDDGNSEAVPPGMDLKKLVQLSTDRDAQVTRLSLMVDTNNLVAGMYSQPVTLTASSKVFWMRDIESEEGAVLAEVKGHKALIMQGSLDRESQEGKFVIKYLANGLFGRYESCEFELRKNKTGWFVQNAYTGRPISDVKVITHSLGITTLQGLCPEK